MWYSETLGIWDYWSIYHRLLIKLVAYLDHCNHTILSTSATYHQHKMYIKNDLKVTNGLKTDQMLSKRFLYILQVLIKHLLLSHLPHFLQGNSPSGTTEPFVPTPLFRTVVSGRDLGGTVGAWLTATAGCSRRPSSWFLKTSTAPVWRIIELHLFRGRKSYTKCFSITA